MEKRARGLADLSRRTGIHEAALSHYYHSRRIPSFKQAKRIAIGRGLTLEQLYAELYGK
tara:strand:- start:556 stop:732 length:177 start_codon:yes stop_codon:yes gene_type:complete